MHQFNSIDRQNKKSPMNIAQVQYLALGSEPSETPSFRYQARYQAKYRLLCTLRRLRRGQIN